VNEPLATLKVQRNGDYVRVVIVGEVDLSNATELERQIEDARSGASKVWVDLTPVTYLDSRGIRVLVQLARRLKMNGVEFFVVAPLDSIAGGVLGLVQIPELRLAEG